MPRLSPFRLGAARWLTAPALSAVVVALLGLGLVGPDRPASQVHAADEPAKPAKKDSSRKLQPRDAAVSAKVEPAEARPGDTVTFRVTAKVEPGWHIYAYNKTLPDDGPRPTQFDLFDAAGLKPKGDWTPSADPTRKAEPAFPDIPFVEYHEDEVTWSLKLTVPADATPGKKTLRCQAAYQLCSDQNCSIPGRWTLDDVTLTVKPATAGAKPKPPEECRTPPLRNDLALLLLTGITTVEDPAPPAGPKPAKKDSNAKFKPKDVTLTTAIDPATAHPGDLVRFKVTAKVNAPWHIYKYSKTQPDSGPRLTSFDLFDPAGLKPEGEWTPSAPPIQKKDPAFADLPFLEFHEDEVTWSLPLRVPADAAPGVKSLQVQAGYMICAQSCSIPGQWTLPAATVTIEPGASTNPAPAASPEPETPAPAPTATPAAEPAPSAVSGSGEVGAEAKKMADLNFLGFLALCAGGGLLALAMPCVWPMIPVTVNFFVKQGQSGNGKTTGLAVTYCLAIIGIFTAIGALFAVFSGAESLSKLGNNFWLNLAIAGLFLVFGLSLLGLFELRLPNFLLNASVQGESRGGLVGVMFMALTLTITSFTCTFPVVGGLLVALSNGDYFRPILGMIVFASVVALPFFLLALSPGLLAKMPKSGDWMNTVKVVGGLIELGAALKFLNTAESQVVVPDEAWTNAYSVLTVWIVLALICGIYLLGLFRTDHDHADAKVGPGRMIFGWGFLSLALYLAPALFGHPPQGKVWYMVVGLLPDVDGLTATAANTGGGSDNHKVEATSTDPATAEREQSTFHGVRWGMSYDQALETARSTGKPVLIDFTGVTCANCRLMEQQVLPKPSVVKALADFVPIQLYTDTVPIRSLTAAQRSELAEKNIDREIKLTEEATNPNYVVVDGEGRLLGKLGGWNSEADFVRFLEGTLRKAKAAPAATTTAKPAAETSRAGG